MNRAVQLCWFVPSSGVDALQYPLLFLFCFGLQCCSRCVDLRDLKCFQVRQVDAQGECVLVLCVLPRFQMLGQICLCVLTPCWSPRCANDGGGCCCSGVQCWCRHSWFVFSVSRVHCVPQVSISHWKALVVLGCPVRSRQTTVPGNHWQLTLARKQSTDNIWSSTQTTVVGSIPFQVARLKTESMTRKHFPGDKLWYFMSFISQLLVHVN